jgi:hypothetical protein
MARWRRDDDDDEDAPSRGVGRPRAPEVYGPPRPEPHEHNQCFERLDALLHSLEISELGRDERLHLQFVMCRADRLRQLDSQRFPTKGDEQATLLLRVVFESTNGVAALTLPILQAVSSCMCRGWLEEALEFMDAMDTIDLVGLHGTLVGLGLEDQLARVLRRRLEEILGPPVVPKPKPKPKKRAKKRTRPACVPESTWREYVSLRKQRLKRPRAA